MGSLLMKGKSVVIETQTRRGIAGVWEFCSPMVLDSGTDKMAGCSSEEDLPDCDCDVNRQINHFILSLHLPSQISCTIFTEV